MLVYGWLTWSSGKNKEGEEASGTITIPEVAHDTEEDEYVVCSLRSQSLHSFPDVLNPC